MYLPLFSRQLWPSAATRGKIGFQGGMHEWISTGAWSIAGTVSKKKVGLLLHDYDQFCDASINDAIRLASAAFESARAVGVCKFDSRSYAWQFIAYYYSGYFAANALMRLCGYACTNLSALDCAEINQNALLCGVGGIDDKSKLAPGVFYSTTSRNPTDVWNLSAVSSKGGVHIQFWTGFLKFLLDLEGFIKLSSSPKSDRDAAVVELRMLIDGLKHSSTSSGAWLSEVRNAMNYRLEFGAWFPYVDADTDGNALKKIFSSAIDGSVALPQTGQTLPAPVRASRISAFMLSWLRISLLTLASASSGNKRKIISEGPLKIGEAVA
jgi:hypothetical protein